MLTMRRNITITGESKIDGKTVEGYSATINNENPENMDISSWKHDKALYKANRIQCRKDAEEFEEAVYALQDTLIAEQKKEEE